MSAAGCWNQSRWQISLSCLRAPPPQIHRGLGSKTLDFLGSWMTPLAGRTVLWQEWVHVKFLAFETGPVPKRLTLAVRPHRLGPTFFRPGSLMRTTRLRQPPYCFQHRSFLLLVSRRAYTAHSRTCAMQMGLRKIWNRGSLQVLPHSTWTRHFGGCG